MLHSIERKLEKQNTTYGRYFSVVGSVLFFFFTAMNIYASFYRKGMTPCATPYKIRETF